MLWILKLYAFCLFSRATTTTTAKTITERKKKQKAATLFVSFHSCMFCFSRTNTRSKYNSMPRGNLHEIEWNLTHTTKHFHSRWKVYFDFGSELGFKHESKNMSAYINKVHSHLLFPAFFYTSFILFCVIKFHVYTYMQTYCGAMGCIQLAHVLGHRLLATIYPIKTDFICDLLSF